MANQSASRTSSGFTLVEVIVALAILSMLVLTTLTGLSSFADTQTRLAAVNERVDKIRMVSAFLREVVGQSIPFGVASAETFTRQSHFQGGESELILVTPMRRGNAATSGTRLMRLSLNEAAQLVVQFHDYQPGLLSAQWADVPQYVLVDDVSQVQFAYRGTDNEWQTQWQEQEVSPSHVRIELQTASRYWPELVIALPSGDAIWPGQL